MGKTKTRMGNDFNDKASIQNGTKWYNEIADDPKNFDAVTEQICLELKNEAKKCYEGEVVHYNLKISKNDPNAKWMKTVMSKGTVSDKIAAATVSIQDNPICSLDKLQILVNLIKPSKKKECTMVIDVLTELFLTDLLRTDQKLKIFSDRPLSLLNDISSGNAMSRKKILSFWYFEDKLKELFRGFVAALNNVAHDVVENNKDKAISAMAKLLRGNPEQEQLLLTNIVNKFGDPSQKVASKAIYNLSQLLLKHPNMQGVVLKEVEKLLYRSNVSQKTQYYSLCFISQFYLSHERNEVAQRLIEVYFSFFKFCIKKGEVDSRMMSALLMGVNRAYPYAKVEHKKFEEHIDTMYRVVHLANFNISLHALSLLLQVSYDGNKVSDRFYSALYKKLADPKLLTTTHHAMFLSLAFKAILKDSENSRVKVFINRLLQVASMVQPAFACGILYLISQVLKKKTDTQSLVLKQTTLNDLHDDENDEEKYSDIKAVLNPDMKEEDEEDIKPDLETLEPSLSGPSWDHRANEKNIKKKRNCYDPLSRNPLYAGGEFCAYTELIRLKQHFHPTVSLYATNIFEGTSIKYSGDPLKDFTLIRFLDRFVYKNPKKGGNVSGFGAHPTFGKRKTYKPTGVRALSVRSNVYLQENLDHIPTEELFLYNFFKNKYKEETSKTDDDDDDDSDLESVQSDEFEAMLDTMQNKSEGLDFFNEIDVTAMNKKNKKSDEQQNNQNGGTDDSSSDLEEDEGSISSEEFSDPDPDFDDEDELEMNMDEKELFEDLDDDMEEMVFSEKNKSSKKSKKKSDDVSVFASAEEFASLLDKEGDSTIAPGTSSVLSNADNAHIKQIGWEEKRDRWLHGFKKTTRKRKFSDRNVKKSKNSKVVAGKTKKFKKVQ